MGAIEFITGHVIYNPAYTYKFQLKTTNAIIKDKKVYGLNKKCKLKCSRFKLLILSQAAYRLTRIAQKFTYPNLCLDFCKVNSLIPSNWN